MINMSQLIFFVVSLMISGLFLFSTPQEALSGSDPGPPPCCDVPDQRSCFSGVDEESYELGFGGDFYPDRPCVGEEGGNAACVAPIPTLNQWGKITTIAVIGLFAVIGIFAMRRRNAVTR